MSKNRVEAFSDGIFAVVLTLLILGIHVPNIANHSSFHQYVNTLVPLIPSIVSFVLTFAIICVHWVSHHYLFRHLRQTPLEIVWLNNLFLLWLCFMPFPTSLLGIHPTDQFPIILFGGNQLLAALTFLAFRVYARKKQLFVDTTSAKNMGPRHSFPAITAYSLSILFVFVNVYLSLLCLFIVPFLYFIPNLIKSR